MSTVFNISELKVKGKFGNLCWKYFCRHHKVQYHKMHEKLFISGELDYFEFINLIYFSCVAYAELNNKDFNDSLNEFCEKFDEVKQETYIEIMNVFTEIKFFGMKASELDKGNNSKKK